VESWEKMHTEATVIHCQPSNKEKKHEVCYMEPLYIEPLNHLHCTRQRIHLRNTSHREHKKQNVYSPLRIENPGCVLPPSIAHQSRALPKSPVVYNAEENLCYRTKGETTKNKCYLEVLARGVKVVGMPHTSSM
jgi:hypothetical protein